MGKTEIKNHFERIAGGYDLWKKKNHYYHRSLKEFFRENVRTEDRVVEFGCGTGDILAAVDARHKVGLDVADAMVRIATAKHSEIRFARHDCETPFLQEKDFDVAILADIVDHATDLLDLYASANYSLKMGGRMCISSINPLWGPIFSLAERLGLKMPEGEHNFVPNRCLVAFLRLRGFELASRGARFLIPRRIPLFSDWMNRLASRLPILNRFCMVQTLVATKIGDYREAFETKKSCSVIVPCYNEEANIETCLARIPRMGAGTEIIVVDDGSTDRTAERVARVAEQRRDVRLISYSPNHGKGHAVKRGFNSASGDILMILDADMTVPPEELPSFFRPLAEGQADFANGTRMVYPMERQSMRFLNLIGNFFFGIVLSWILSRRVSDTLCGTKALRRSDYAHIRMGPDRWGDFDLLFGAAENGLTLIEIPVHYRARTADLSKMRPFQHCVVLARVCLTGFFRLKLRGLSSEQQ